MTVDDVGDRVRTILSARGAGTRLEPDLPLCGGGLALDSIALVEVLLECEECFGVRLAAELLGPSPLTVGSLTEHIRALVAR